MLQISTIIKIKRTLRKLFRTHLIQPSFACAFRLPETPLYFLALFKSRVPLVFRRSDSCLLLECIFECRSLHFQTAKNHNHTRRVSFLLSAGKSSKSFQDLLSLMSTKMKQFRVCHLALSNKSDGC